MRLSAAALLLVATQAGAGDKALIGKWNSTGDQNSSAGQMVLAPKGKLTMAPAGHYPAEGRWDTANGWLDMDLSTAGMGKASARYELSANGKQLILYYASGTTQQFSRKH